MHPRRQGAIDRFCLLRLAQFDPKETYALLFSPAPKLPVEPPYPGAAASAVLADPAELLFRADQGLQTRRSPNSGNHVLESVCCEGTDILWLENEDSAPEPGAAPLRKMLDLKEFERMRSEQTLVALHLPRVKYVSFAVQG